MRFVIALRPKEKELNVRFWSESEWFDEESWSLVGDGGEGFGSVFECFFMVSFLVLRLGLVGFKSNLNLVKEL